MNETIMQQYILFLEEAKAIIEPLNERGIPLRIIGALAFYHQCPGHRELYEKMQRAPTDIDFVGYSKHRKEIQSVLESRGYEGLERLNVLFGMKRQIYRHPETNLYIDIFYDVLDMCHKVNFKGRLEFDPLTISLTDLVLEKMQIVHINEKDIKDTILLFLEHDLSDGDESKINATYIAEELSKDWGYYYTVTTNLKKCKTFADNYDWLTDEDRRIVKDRIDRLLKTVEDKPKSRKWKLRAKIGTKKKWYQDVGGERAGFVHTGDSWAVKGSEV